MHRLSSRGRGEANEKSSHLVVVFVVVGSSSHSGKRTRRWAATAFSRSEARGCGGGIDCQVRRKTTRAREARQLEKIELRRSPSGESRNSDSRSE